MELVPGSPRCAILDLRCQARPQARLRNLTCGPALEEVVPSSNVRFCVRIVATSVPPGTLPVIGRDVREGVRPW